MFDELMVNIKTEICHNIFRSASSMMAFENFLRNVPQQTAASDPTSAFGGGTTTASSGGTGSGQRKGSDVVSEAAAAAEAQKKPSQSAPAQRSAATIRAPAAAARNTSTAAGNECIFDLRFRICEFHHSFGRSSFIICQNVWSRWLNWLPVGDFVEPEAAFWFARTKNGADCSELLGRFLVSAEQCSGGLGRNPVWPLSLTKSIQLPLDLVCPKTSACILVRLVGI